MCDTNISGKPTTMSPKDSESSGLQKQGGIVLGDCITRLLLVRGPRSLSRASGGTHPAKVASGNPPRLCTSRPVTLLVLIPIIAVEYSSQWPIHRFPAPQKVTVTRNMIGWVGGWRDPTPRKDSWRVVSGSPRKNGPPLHK